MNTSEVRRLVLDELKLCRELGYDDASTASKIVDRLHETGALDDGEDRGHP